MKLYHVSSPGYAGTRVMSLNDEQLSYWWDYTLVEVTDEEVLARLA